MDNIILKDVDSVLNTTLVNWEQFNHKTILITDVNGMLLSYMVFVLLALRDRFSYNLCVYALVRNREKGETLFRDFFREG